MSSQKQPVIDYSSYRFKSRNKKVAWILSFTLGIFGAHQFYYRRYGSASAMLLISLTYYGLWITVPWVVLNIIKITLGYYDADYDAKALVSKYNTVLNAYFIDDYKWYKKEYPKLYSKYEFFIFKYLTNKVELNGSKHEQLALIKEKCGLTNHSAINKLNKLIEYDRLIEQPLEQIQVDYELYNNETCYYVSDCIWNEICRNRSGVEYLKEIERGKALITNKRIVLFGREKNKRIYLNRIRNVFPGEEGCYIEKDKGRNAFLTNMDAMTFYIQFQKVIKKIANESK
ncbi:TM2 domain-containing protein [Haloplasma contractile]